MARRIFGIFPCLALAVICSARALIADDSASNHFPMPGPNTNMGPIEPFPPAAPAPVVTAPLPATNEDVPPIPTNEAPQPAPPAPPEAPSPAPATNSAPAPPPTRSSNPVVVITFDGTAPTTTAVFQVQDNWEVRWSCLRVVSVGVFSPDGTLVAGGAGVLRGSLYLPHGGSYYLQIKGEPDGGSVPSDNPAPPIPSVPGVTNPAAWHVVVSQLDTTNPPPALSVYEPNFSPPQAAPDSISPILPPAPTTPAFTGDQARAIVRISGDNLAGAGFLVHTPDGPIVVTNLHVIANNPGLKITTSAGDTLPLLSAKAAADRDIALLSVPEGKNSFLQASTTITQDVQPGDAILTPIYNSDDASSTAQTGQVVEVDADHIDYKIAAGPETSGSPLFHVTSGKVIGIATEIATVPTLRDLQSSSFANRQAALQRRPHFTGLRVDAVANWLSIDLKQFQVETDFLGRFHEKSRSLDSYLNPSNGRWRGGENGSSLYRTDAAIMKANSLFLQLIVNADPYQRADALQGLLFDLGGIAKSDLDRVEDRTNFFPFDQSRAQQEAAYRKALIAELDAIGNNPARLRALPK